MTLSSKKTYTVPCDLLFEVKVTKFFLFGRYILLFFYKIIP